jgi:methyl-accepting chemotaxis protein
MSTLASPGPAPAGLASGALIETIETDVAPVAGDQRPAFDGLAAEVGACLPVLRALGRQLTDTIRHVETSVVQVCQGFSGMAERARQTVDETARHMGGDASQSAPSGFTGLVGQARVTLHHLLSGIERSSEFSVAMAERMQVLAGRIDGMKASLAAMDSIADRARVLALNAKIEAARLGDKGSTFKVLASETADLSNKTGQASQTLSEIVRELNTSSVDASSELRQRADADRLGAAKSRTEVNGLLDMLTATSEELQTLVQRSHSASQGLAKDIGAAVTGLQFQDAVSQRVSHVVETLQEIDESLVRELGGLEAAQRIADEQSAAQQHWIKRMADRYTMAEEHGAAGTSQNSDIGNNVELF